MMCLGMIKIDEDNLFLLNERKKCRIGSMSEADRNFMKKKHRTAILQEVEDLRKRRFDAMEKIQDIYLKNLIYIFISEFVLIYL